MVCLVECNSASMACLEVAWVEEPVVEWLLTLMRYSRCSWVNRWEAWMIPALKVLWDEVVAEVVVEVVDFNNKGVVLEEVDSQIVREVGLVLTCEVQLAYINDTFF